MTTHEKGFRSSDPLTQTRSVSQTEQYEKCAYQWYLKRIQRVVPRPAAWSMHGTAFHSAAEALELSGRQMTEEEAVSVFSDQYSDLVNKALDQEPDLGRWLTAGGKPAGQDIADRYQLGQQQTRDYVRYINENAPKLWTTPDGKPGVELHFVVELGGVKVQGFIDLLMELPDAKKAGESPKTRVRPRDLKTGSTKSHFQLETYGIATQMLYDVEVNDADWWLAKEGRLSRPVKLEGVTAEKLGERYAAMDEGVKAGRFPAQPSFACRFCDVAWACSAKQ